MGQIELPVIPKYCESNYHLFHVLVKDAAKRDEVLKELQYRGIHAVFHYVPLHLSKAGSQFQVGGSGLPVTEDVSRRLIRLPIYPGMDSQQQEFVISEFVQLVKEAG